VHLWCAFAGGFVAVALGVSGTVLVFREEIERALYEPRVAPSTVRGSVSTAAARASALHPDRRLALAILPVAGDAPYEFVLQIRGARSLEEADQLSVYVDPSSGTVISERRRRDSFIWTLRDLHFALFSGVPGLTADGIFGGLLAVMSLTGLVLWAARTSGRIHVQWQASWRRITWDLHQLVGAGACLVLVLTGLTGVYYAFRGPVTAVILAATLSPPLERPPTIAPSEGKRPLDLDALVAGLASLAAPRAVAVVRFPASPAQPYTVTTHGPDEVGESVESGPSALVDPSSGRVLRWTHTADDSRGLRLLGLIEPLHYGTIGGLPTRLVWAIGGLTPAFLVVSGAVMWWNRRRRSP
jgi:uncharacterized iron-regulated membrane protein